MSVIFCSHDRNIPIMSFLEIRMILCSEYYFSAENLQKDFFLRRKMSPEGFLPLKLISSFPRVRALTQDVALIMEALRDSTQVIFTNLQVSETSFRSG